ncbi:hypothetical protein SAMN05444280_10355 [Tangfeifania diversioriginum]|uniref:Uncharacterized protein n=2 Tax=Tangfeifania diversioriginum TaxID=1168035 RepID=A0A1M6BWM4_9BACT|nr:hypothetical protein SAMN05444280_10355 [Tangfeifania diversioriginum]
MFAVRGIFNGKEVKLTDPVSEKKSYKVVVTFIEEIPEEENDSREFAAQTDSFDFWENTAEDIYQDYLTPSKKNNEYW